MYHAVERSLATEFRPKPRRNNLHTFHTPHKMEVDGPSAHRTHTLSRCSQAWLQTDKSPAWGSFPGTQ
jgi:hypothetical protein